MLRTALLLLLAVHGLIHLIGSRSAFGRASAASPGMPISRPEGALWSLAAVLFCASALLLLLHHDPWWMAATAALVLSQVLILRRGREARFGTVANVLVLVAVVFGAATWSFRREHQRVVDAAMRRASTIPEHIVTDNDLLRLPPPIQRYLRAAGAVGAARPRSMTMTFTGTIRSKDGPWMPFTSTQVNTLDMPVRTFWMDAVMKGLPTKGLHNYINGSATMRIRLLGAIPVFDVLGPELDTAETVTWFNDLCLYAPGALTDPRITWLAIDDRTAEATFEHKGIRISAVLVFDANDLLVDFISEDRYYLMPDGRMVRKRFSTPASDHRAVNGLRLPHHGETAWYLEEGPFTYGRFDLTSLQYDVSVPTP